MNILFRCYQWILWNILTRFIFINFFLKKAFPFYHTPDSQPFPKAPFLVVANHGTFFDPWIIGSYTHSPLGIMTNDDGFREGMVTKWYLKSIGAFPKKKGASDYRAMKKTLSLLRNGIPVCIFPEGQTTWDGETQLLHTGIEKLLQRAKCPLVTVRLQGNFLMKPWWAHRKRSGRILTTVTVHSPETLSKLSGEEIFNLIKRSIYQNDIKDPKNIAAAFSGSDCALGLERFVWICLNCSAEDTLETCGNRITCSSCGNFWEIDAYGRLSAPSAESTSCNDLKDWAELHKIRVKEMISRKPEVLTRSDCVVLQQEGEQHLFTDTDTGTITLSPETLRFQGKAVDLLWPIGGIEEYVIQKKDLFEFRYGEQYFRFVFSGKSPLKWIFYIRYLKGFEQCEKQGHL